tara:strand:+ start:3839 stop:4264 length:426 start_codon:yes stop_codon:yes gene_type:complete
MENTRLDIVGPTLTDLAWLAGFVDGEGHVALHHGSAIIDASSVDYKLLEEVHKIGGGNLYTEKRKSYDHCFFKWQVVGAEARDLMRALYPYLKYKKAQVDIILMAPHFNVSKCLVRKNMCARLKELKHQRSYLPYKFRKLK